MRTRTATRVASVIALSVALAGGMASGATAAQDVTSGSFSFSGDADDWITDGRSLAFSTDAGDDLSTWGTVQGDSVTVSAGAANGVRWYLNLGNTVGQPLTPGTYTDDYPYHYDDPGPTVYFQSDISDCQEHTGTFTVTDVEFGPYGYVRTFDASFEQHCGGTTGASRGEVHVHNPAPPEQLTIGLGIDADGTANRLNGNATVSGTVTCAAVGPVQLNGSVVQVDKDVLTRAPFSLSVPCEPGGPVPWTATVVPPGTVPFTKGDVEVSLSASANDPNYPRTAEAHATAAVRLSRS